MMIIEPPPPPLTRAELERDKAHARRVRAELRAENALLAYPKPVCRGCKFPMHADEMDDVLFPRRCTTCSIQRLERIIRRAVHRRGRRRTVKALRRLAR